jgi:hypothetical protein
MYSREEIINKIKEFGVVRCIRDYTDKAKKNKYYEIGTMSSLDNLKQVEEIISITLNNNIFTFIRYDTFHLYFEFKTREDRINELLEDV